MRIPLFLQEVAGKDVKGEIDVSTTSIIEKLDNTLDKFIKLLPNIGMAIVLLVVFYFVSKWIGKSVKKALIKKDRRNYGEILGGFLRWTILLVGIGLAVTTISPNMKFADLIAGLGVSSVAIGFAFKDILQNWMAGLLILMRQPFEIGDEISVNGITGSVERIETRATIISRYDGQRVVIPNSEIYTNAVRVITANEYIRSQYDLGLGYNEDYREAMKILRKTVKGIDGVISDKPIDILVWDQGDYWLTIRMRWWTDPKRSDVVSIYSDVLLKTQEAMDEAGMDLPFPTHVEIQNAKNIREAQNFAERIISGEGSDEKKSDEKTKQESVE